MADPHRICIYGGSYGGYAALMGALREPSLYRCAAGMAGVYDLNKMYSWGDIYRSDYGLAYLHTVLGTDKTVLAARSPSEHAADIRIPVFLAHGVDDGRVPVDHARAMKKAMTKAGHDFQYVEYPYEGHGLALEDDRMDFYGRLLSFLDANTTPVPTDMAATSSK
jgi:dipeptidyl aminopeptidase/acylaminoacyl peptidase